MFYFPCIFFGLFFGMGQHRAQKGLRLFNLTQFLVFLTEGFTLLREQPFQLSDANEVFLTHDRFYNAVMSFLQHCQYIKVGDFRGQLIEQEARWQQWYEEDKEHQWAWQQVANLRSQLSHVPANVASRVLHDTHLTRRHVLKGLLLLLGVGGGWQLWQSETGEGLRADYRTDKGAVSHQLLEDDSQLTLNTQSAADVPFDVHQRAVHLWYGEIAITTAKDAQQRPFRVMTR